jgi:hypothetical protein
MALGRTVVGPKNQIAVQPAAPVSAVNTRTALWPERWPAIALRECIDLVEQAPLEERAAVKRHLPCAACHRKSSCLNAKRKELGPLLYDREILTSPRSQESTLFPFERFAPMLDTSLEMVPMWRKPEHDPSRYIVVSGWDLAWSERVGGDRLVRCTAMYDRVTHKRRLLNLQRYPAGLKYAEQCSLIELAWGLFQDDLVVIESDAAQKIWAQTMESTTAVPVYRHEAGEDKRSLATGVPSLLIDLDSERWVFPYAKDGLGFDEMQNLLTEAEAFGFIDGRLEGVGEHDDAVMAWWHCTWGLRLMSSPIGEEFVSGLNQGRQL